MRLTYIHQVNEFSIENEQDFAEKPCCCFKRKPNSNAVNSPCNRQSFLNFSLFPFNYYGRFLELPIPNTILPLSPSSPLSTY